MKISTLKNTKKQNFNPSKIITHTVAPRGVDSNNIEPDTRMAKNRKDFRWFSSAGTAMDIIVNVTNNEFVRI